MIPVAILCGGLGTRLGELTRNLPKPMIDVGGRPYLERVVESFAKHGLCDIVFLTGYRGDVIEQHFGDGSRFGVRIRYSHEQQPLGTGGALRDARPLLADRFVLTYGDVLRDFDYAAFVRTHPRNCLAVYFAEGAGGRAQGAEEETTPAPCALPPAPSPIGTPGNAEVVGGRVVRFDKKPKNLPFVDAGFSVVETRWLDLIPAVGAASFEEIVYAELARRGELEAEVVDLDFYDIGTPEELARTRAALERT